MSSPEGTSAPPERRYRTTAVLTPALARIPHFAAFLPESGAIVCTRGRVPAKADSIAGWAAGRESERDRRIAERRNLPYLAIDDGFIRSLGPAAAGFAPLSLVVDPVGIYYDATRPSALELLLESDAPLPLDDAIEAIAHIRSERLTKINAAPDIDLLELEIGARELVLVVDQPRGGPKVEQGLGSERQFQDMLDAAIDENPGAAVVVKLHPEVVAGRAQGFLAERARERGVIVLDHDVNPFGLLEEAKRVYTVTSQVGIEALMYGTPVSCFGAPFYAGWGATDDRAKCERRTRRRSPLEITAAAYLCYARYVDPFTGRACSLRHVLERLSFMKRANERNRGQTTCVGFARAEERAIRPFVTGTDSTVVFAPSGDEAVERAAAESGRICVWAASEPEGLAGQAHARSVPLIRVADGFLHSAGLEGPLAPVVSFAFDRRGIYHHARTLSELEEILEFEDFDPSILARARQVRERLVESGVTKYSQGRDGPCGFEGDPRRRILVPGQIENNPAVGWGDYDIANNYDLVRLVRQQNPEACIIYKPHPTMPASARRGADDERELSSLCDHVLRDTSAHAAIAAVDEVHTLSSLIGFEALLRGRKVVVYGTPFYAGWGLTEDRHEFPRRTRRLDLDQLVAGALLLYPTYVDPVTALACEAETVVERFAEAKRQVPRARWSGRELLRRIGRYLRGLARLREAA